MDDGWAMMRRTRGKKLSLDYLKSLDFVRIRVRIAPNDSRRQTCAEQLGMSFHIYFIEVYLFDTGTALLRRI